jgi:hypothetical protein
MAEGGLLAWRWLGAALCAAALLSGLAAAQSATGGEKLNREQVEQLMRAEDAALLRHLEGAANLDSVKLGEPATREAVSLACLQSATREESAPLQLLSCLHGAPLSHECTPPPTRASQPDRLLRGQPTRN